MSYDFPTDHWWKRLIGWIVIEGCRETQRRLLELSREVKRREAAAMVFVLEFADQQPQQET